MRIETCEHHSTDGPPAADAGRPWGWGMGDSMTTTTTLRGAARVAYLAAAERGRQAGARERAAAERFIAARAAHLAAQDGERGVALVEWYSAAREWRAAYHALTLVPKHHRPAASVVDHYYALWWDPDDATSIRPVPGDATVGPTDAWASAWRTWLRARGIPVPYPLTPEALVDLGV